MQVLWRLLLLLLLGLLLMLMVLLKLGRVDGITAMRCGDRIVALYLHPARIGPAPRKPRIVCQHVGRAGI